MKDGTGMEPMGMSHRLASNTSQNTNNNAAPRTGVTFQNGSMAGAGVQRQTSTRIGASVNRNQSVRSIMTFKTLPEYSEEPGSHEQVWREGERAGMDSVVQLPDEAAIEEERRREEEMEAQYQLRLARQNVREGREVRRQARESGDARRIREANEVRNRTVEREELERLRAEHDAVRKRPRAVSKVEYGNLGLVAAGGRRIRANSEESERPLLQSAANMAEDEADLGNPRRMSDLQPPQYDDFEHSGEPSPAYTSPTERQSSNSFFRPPPQSPSSQSPASPPRSGSLRQLTPQNEPAGLGFEDIDINAPQSTVIPSISSSDVDMPAPLNLGSRGSPKSMLPQPISRASSTSPSPPDGITPPVISRKESAKDKGKEIAREQPPSHIDLPKKQRFSMPPQSSLSPQSGSGSLNITSLPLDRVNSNGSDASLASDSGNPQRMDTVQRRRRSINDLMGGAGRPASTEQPKRQSFVLHTPPIASPSPPMSGASGGDSRRSSMIGMLPKLGRLDELGGGSRNASSTSLNSQHSVSEQPTIMVEAATPVATRGKTPLGWEIGKNERRPGSGVSGR